MTPVITIKRAYEKPSKTDGYRVLVDRLWPRGLSKEALPYDEWWKDAAPSDELRKWFGHDPERWATFKQRYKTELNKNEALLVFVEEHKDKKKITLVYGAADTEHNHAIVLQQYLEKQFVHDKA